MTNTVPKRITIFAAAVCVGLFGVDGAYVNGGVIGATVVVVQTTLLFWFAWEGANDA